MYSMQNYADQMGGFDFTLTQRYFNFNSQKLNASIKKCHQTLVI
jgi:hypothetical protein